MRLSVKLNEFMGSGLEVGAGNTFIGKFFGSDIFVLARKKKLCFPGIYFFAYIPDKIEQLS